MAAVRKSIQELFQEGRAFEAASDLPAATKAYQALLKRNPLYWDAYARLMVLYRKQQLHREEQVLIKAAINNYETDVKASQTKWTAKNTKAARISKALANALGLLNKKGLPTSEDKQISLWRKRLTLLNERIKRVALTKRR